MKGKTQQWNDFATEYSESETVIDGKWIFIEANRFQMLTWLHNYGPFSSHILHRMIYHVPSWPW